MHAFYNQATLSYNDITMNSNVVCGRYTEPLSISKSVISDSFSTGDAITYSVSIVNTAPAPCEGLILEDDLGCYSHSCGSLVPLSYIPGTLKMYKNGVLQKDPDLCAGPNMILSGINVPACGNILILYCARANQYAPLGPSACIVNTARLSGGSLAAPIQASASLNAADSTLLTISKAICPAVISGNEPVCYTIVIQNSGSTAVNIADNVIITDIFDPVLNITGVYFNGKPWSCPENYSYNPATGLFATAANQICVPAASYSQNMSTGAWATTPGTSTLTISGNLFNSL